MPVNRFLNNYSHIVIFMTTISQMDISKCSLFVFTDAFGADPLSGKNFSTQPETTVHLIWHAICREISINSPLKHICNQIKSQLPSLEWQRLAIKTVSTKSIVSHADFNLVSSYRN